MKRLKRKMSPGVSRARRPKTGNNRGMLILLNEEEKMNIEKAAAREGVSMSRFIVERALHWKATISSPRHSMLVDPLRGELFRPLLAATRIRTPSLLVDHV